MGSTGVVDRVSGAYNQAARDIASLAPDPEVPLTVEIRVFGFSRGAAAARHFVYRAVQGNYLNETLARRLVRAKGYTQLTLSATFAGLFDTVASLGVYHGNDVRELDLDAIRHVTCRVVQLAAADEFRDNFSLTDISSSENGIEVYLPGVHSDIGGGYRDSPTNDEVNLLVLELPWNPVYESQLNSSTSMLLNTLTGAESPMVTQRREWNARLDQDQEWWLRHGWCRTTDQFSRTANTLSITRRRLRYHYQFIPLHILARFARRDGVGFTDALEENTQVDANLAALRTPSGQTVEEHLTAYAEGGRSSAADWRTPHDWLTRLRAGWFHMSAHYTAMYGLVTPMQPLFRTLSGEIGTDWTHRQHGRRARRVYRG